MKRTIFCFFLLVLMVFLFSCKRNPHKADLSDIKNEIKIVRFDQELFSINDKDTLTDLLNLRNEYPDFFDLFTYRVIRIGGIDDEEFPGLIKQFITDTLILNVKQLVDNEYSDFNKTASQLIKAFKYFQYHFPDKELPTIFTCVSGFNQSVVTAERLIGISLDKYLGRECRYYKILSTTPQYKIKNMHNEKLVSDVAYAWGITEFENTNKATNLLGNIIHQGKLMYFVDALLPEVHDTLKIGYTEKELSWCEMNEPEMWTYLVEKKMLYSNKRMDIIRYINDAPTTSGFPLDSPGKTGVWIGWQIVKEYMEKNPDITLPELMLDSDYQNILNASGYFPE